MAKATLTISSKNYSSWSLRGWLLTKFSGLEFEEIITAPDDASARAEILLLSSSILVPCLRHEGATVWDTLAIADYLNEVMPDAGLLPADRVQRAHCRSICGEIHSGFTTLRASLPVNLKGHFPDFKIWSRAQADIDRVCTIWRECLAKSGGPFLFGERTMADAMYAPVVTRFMTYDVKLEPRLKHYADMIMAHAGNAGMDRGRQGRARRYRRARGRILGSAGDCAACLQGLSIGQALLNFMPSEAGLCEPRRPRRSGAGKIALTEIPSRAPTASPCSTAAILEIAALQRGWRDFRMAHMKLVNAAIRAAKKLDAGDCRGFRQTVRWRPEMNQHAVVNKFSHVKPADTEFTGGGLRDFFLYRDLGIAAATGGQVICHLVKANADMPPEGVHRLRDDFI